MIMKKGYPTTIPEKKSFSKNFLEKSQLSVGVFLQVFKRKWVTNPPSISHLNIPLLNSKLTLLEIEVEGFFFFYRKYEWEHVGNSQARKNYLFFIKNN